MFASFRIYLHQLYEISELSIYSDNIAHDNRKFINIEWWIFCIQLEKTPPKIVSFIPKIGLFPEIKFTPTQKNYWGGYRRVYVRWLALEFLLEFDL